MDVKNKTLKPCPFCGGEAKKEANEIKGLRHLYVVCKKCGASSPIFRTTKNRIRDAENPSIKAWNIREPMDEILKQLENHAIEFETFGMCSDYVELTHAIEIVKGGGSNEQTA